MSEVTIIARAKAKPGTEEEMERALRANAETSRCLIWPSTASCVAAT